MNPPTVQRHLIAWGVIRGGLADFGVRGDGSPDDDGKIGPRTRKAIQAFQRALGFPETGEVDAALVEALRCEVFRLHEDVPSLGLRALAIALREWANGVQEEPLGSNTSPRIKEYFEVCERDGKAVKMRAGEWCSAAASWCVYQALLSNEASPHGFRIGGMEIQGDLTRSGHWHPLSEAIAGKYVPKMGDIVVLTRPTAASWTRHICRLVTWTPNGFWTLGGNEGNRWRLTFRRVEDGQLLGFGSY